MGLSSKKTKSTAVTTPTNPVYVDNALSGLVGQTMDLSKRDPTSFVANADPLQTQGGASAQTLGAGMPAAQSLFNQGTGDAVNLTRSVGGASAPQMTASTASPFISNYMNPYLNDVVNSSLADYDFGAGQTRAQNKLSLALDDTFGGSSGGVQTALSEGDLARGRGLLSSNLRSQGWDTALGAAQQDAGRAQEASHVNAGLLDSNLSRQLMAAGQMGQLANQGLTGALAGDENQRNNIGTQMTAGDMLRQIQQQKQAAPLNLLGTQAGLIGSLPLNLENGQTTKTTTKSSGGLLDSLAKAAQVAAAVAAFSDERLKDDIETVGHDAKGRRWVDFRYHWDEPGTRRRGVIAQEVAKTDPHAVSTHESGYLMVNYGDLH